MVDETEQSYKRIVADNVNRTYNARLIYKSGAVQDLSDIAAETNEFDLIRIGFLKYLKDGTPKHAFYAVGNGSITINWPDVSSFQHWIE